MRDLLDFLVSEADAGNALEAEKVAKHLGLKGRVYDLTVSTRGVVFTDETKSQIFYRQALEHAQGCPICGGLLDATKSVSYDHITPVRSGGLGAAENGQMVHPYCNTAMKG